MDTKTEHNIEKIFCYNCKIPEETATVNNRRESKLIIVKQHFGPLNFKNLLLVPLPEGLWFRT